MQPWSEETVNEWRRHHDESAVHWGRWADKLAEQQDKINQALLAAAGVATGMTLLDLACGAGEPAVTASRLVGTEGRVTATDLSLPMQDALRERIARHGLANVHCQQADMKALPFADASFDAVTCRFGLMYARDPARAIAESARVLRGGGRVAYMVWGPEQNNSVLFLGIRAANDFLGRPIGDAEFQASVRFAEPGAVADLMHSAGLEEAREQELIVEPRIKVGIPFWAPLLEMNAARIWQGLATEERQRVHQAVAQAYSPFVQGEHYVLKTHMRIASAVRPASGG